MRTPGASRIKAKDTRCCFHCSGDAAIIDRLVMQGRSTKPLVSPLVRLMQDMREINGEQNGLFAD